MLDTKKKQMIADVDEELKTLTLLRATLLKIPSHKLPVVAKAKPTVKPTVRKHVRKPKATAPISQVTP